VYVSQLFKDATAHLAREEAIGTIEVLDPTLPGRGFVPIGEAIELARSAGLPVPTLRP
jgi:hypothetical protein